MYGMLQGLPLLSTAEQLDEVSSFLSASGPAADVPPLIKARCGSHCEQVSCG